MPGEQEPTQESYEHIPKSILVPSLGICALATVTFVHSVIDPDSISGEIWRRLFM